MASCPRCKRKCLAVDSRDDGMTVRRRRQCVHCELRWTTYESPVNGMERLEALETALMEAERHIRSLRHEVQKELRGETYKEIRGPQSMENLPNGAVDDP
jgi:transcriptional regulator NrdR family protein